jgi:hypothetical protein
MSGPLTTARGIVHACYHQFLLADIGENPQLPFSFPSNGLVLTGRMQPGIAIIFTGVHTGKVAVSVEVYDTQPEQLNTADWEEVVEASMEAITGRVMVTGGPTAGMPPDHLPVLSASGAGPYRVRVHARGRDTNVDGTAFEPVEDYLVMVWPAPAMPETVHKQTDGYGASVREAASNVRPDSPTSKPTFSRADLLDASLQAQQRAGQGRSMNEYGVLAERHWRRWLPRRVEQLVDPDDFFAALGEEAASRFADLTANLAGVDPPGETVLERMRRLNAAALRAEEMVVSEMVLLPPEPGER